MDFTQYWELIFRGGLFLGLICLFMLLESLAPKRRLTSSRILRWRTNLGLGFLNMAALRILGPVTAIGAALYAEQAGWGLLQQISLSNWISIALTILLMDLAIYGQHVATHKINLLWRLHQVHHSDKDIDTTTALRFHTLEILLSMLYKAMIVLLLGPLVIAVLIYEILLNSMALFNHANLSLPKPLDRTLRWLIVTPDMHRIHHSSIPFETDSNYGNILSIWDRLFRTYNSQPQDGHSDMTIGLQQYTDEPTELFFWSLRLPFTRSKR